MPKARDYHLSEEELQNTIEAKLKTSDSWKIIESIINHSSL